MASYIVRRLLQMVPVLILVSVFVFFILHIAPGNPALMIAGPDASIEVIEEIEAELGLDLPLYEQYLRWAGNVVRGDLGRSLRTRIPVTEELLEYMPNTLALAFVSITISSILGIIIGVISAVRQNTPLDTGIVFVAVSGISAPSFVRALLLMWVFAITFEWFPISGRPAGPLFSLPVLHAMALPALALAIGGMASLARLSRSSFLEVLRQDYVRTARAKGLSERVVQYKHALKNAMLPVITILGFRLGAMFGGSVIVETVFAWPGVGRRIIGAIGTRDFPVIQGAVLMLATVYVLVNLLTDISYAYVDPRIRYD